MFDVSANEMLVKTNGGNKVASGPQAGLFVQPRLVLDLFLHPGTALAFEHLHGIRDAVFRGEEGYQVDVVILDVQFQDFPMFPLADGLKDSPEFLFDLGILEYFATVLRRPDNMVLQVVKAMC